MPVAKRPQKSAPIQTAVEKLLRGLIYYAALLSCVVIAIGVSFSVFLYVARDSVRDNAPGREAAVEAQALEDYARELRDIANALNGIVEASETPAAAFSRRLNDLRRRMRQFPHDSDALNALIQTGDRLLAWAATPESAVAKDRAFTSLREAEAVVKRRVQALQKP